MTFLQITDPKAKTNKKDSSEDQIKQIAIGIDLGTSNTVVSYYNENTSSVEIIPINGNHLLPSIVWFKDNKIIVGESPKKEDQVEYIFTSMKRYMGKASKDIKNISELNFKINEKESSQTLKILVGNNKELFLEEIIAEILKKIKKEAEIYLNCIISKAVITVPAYFDESARVATKNAAKLASLEVLRLINEPTSAALAYGLDEKTEGVYIVYDLGGGTFDVSILKLQKGIFKVLSTTGDLSLGGDDIDQIILNQLLDSLNNVENIIAHKRHLLLIAKEIKEELSNCSKVVKHFKLDNQNVMFQLTKNDFEELIKPLINKTISLIKNAVKDSKEDILNIKGVILVGGSTRISCIKEIIEKEFNVQTLCSINPDEVVSIGAAYQAANLTGVSNSSLLLDVIPLSLGLEIAGGIVEKIIPRNSPIPIAKAQEFTTFKDDQTSMMIHILQGERELAEDLRSLGKFTLTSIPKMKAGKARIKVIFTIDADGLLTVSAEEQTTKIKQEIEIKPTWGLSIDDMRKMLEVSMENAKEDIEKRLLNETISDAKILISTTEKAIEEDVDLLIENEEQKIRTAIVALEDTLKNTNTNRNIIHKYVEELENITREFAHRRMSIYVEKALKGKKVEEVEKLLGKNK